MLVGELRVMYDPHVDESSAQDPAVPVGATDTASQRLDLLVARYRDRLAFLFGSYRSAHAFRRAALSYNESLNAGARSLNPRAKSKRPPARINYELELLINVRATELALARRSNSERPTQSDINAASVELIARSKPRRGRPSDPILAYHVQAYMALHRQTCGEELRAGLTRNGEYDPHIKSRIQDTMLGLFRSIDPSVTIATIAEIMKKVQRSGDLKGKRFEDFFPFYGGGVDPDTGHPTPGPGFRLVEFVEVAPIYSS